MRTIRFTPVVTLLAAAMLITAVAGAGGPPPKVNSADPPSAEQGTVGLDVSIKGSNFAPGSQVRFLVSGTQDEDEVVVNNVTFVDSTELTANIDVEDQAIVGDYDIEVLAAGRRGKGRETFAVTLKGGGNPSTITITGVLRNAPGDSVLSSQPATPFHDGEVLGQGISLVFDHGGAGAPFVLLLGNLAGNLETVESPCPGNPSQVCFSNGDPLLASYNIGPRTIEGLPNGRYCDGSPSSLLIRDMITGDCIKAYASSGSGGRGTDPTSRKRGIKLRCGKEANEGDNLQVACTAHDAEGCTSWYVKPCLDDGSGLTCGPTATGSERLICQLYEVPLKGGNRTNIELGEYNVLFAFDPVSRDP